MKLDIFRAFAVITTGIVFTVSILISAGVLNNDLLIPGVLALILAIGMDTLSRDRQTSEKLKEIEKSISFNTKTLCEFSKQSITTSPRVRIVDDPRMDNEWKDFEKCIDAFNAPWSLVNNDLYLVFKQYMKNKNNKIRVVIFEGHSEKCKSEYQIRLKRLKTFISSLEEEHVRVNGRIMVKKVSTNKSPTSTFFLSEKQGKKSSILYIYPFIAGDKPMMSFEVNDTSCISGMAAQFETSWAEGEKINVC